MRRSFIMGLWALGSVACTESLLEPITDVDIRFVDNLLRVEGRLCTDPPEESDFPTKILFLIDGSGSMQFVDPFTRRALAVEEAILRLSANPSVEFAIVRFNESDAVLTKPESQITTADPFGVDLSGAFTRSNAVLADAVRELQEADSVTDYQGALSTAFLILAQDMIDSPPAELARTKYVVLFLSDGDPFPTCCSDESAAQGLCTQERNIPFCDDPDAIRANPTQLPFLEAGQDYNQPYQIFDVIQDIMELAENFGVGELRINTAFLFDPTLVDDVNPATGCFEIAGVNFVCPEDARELLGRIAEIGQGVFRDFSNAEEIDFLGFDVSNIKRDNALKNLIATNVNALPTSQGLRPDSDGDGLDDDLEFEEQMDRSNRDSDGDGFSDPVEYRFRRNGLDPLSFNPGCEEGELRDDLDADGLLTCEEILLRTSTDLFDTDADGVPDGLEVMYGTLPNESDNLRDADLDGRRNGDEIRFHTSIGFDEANQRVELAYRYETDEVERNERGGRCYDFTVRNIQLETPLARPGEDRSFARNDIFVYTAEAPFDDPNDFGRFKVACVQGRYIAPDFKDPLGGVVQLCPDDFREPFEITPDDCVGLEGTALKYPGFPNADPCGPEPQAAPQEENSP
ncbi:MAG TPA: VWA domain-containing protein [Myxococcales bacterium LLY-WYZ-16_1]|nr:VWA domain-containing protein [Myxococcales bacterium LLY-WYZ-16_1]